MTDRFDLLRALDGIGRAQADPELERAVGEAWRRLKRRAKTRRGVQTRDHDRTVLAGATRFHTEVPPTAPAPAGSIPAPAGSAASPVGSAPAPDGSATTPGPAAGSVALLRHRRCYVCKRPYQLADADYHLMCPDCAATNRERRDARCDLHGRRAVVTGGRIKIGFHTALKLLRDGAEVLVTTRFPRDAARRYAAVPDAAAWLDRLHIQRADLLRLDDVRALVGRVGACWDRLDILVNNAAQTLARPEAYHREVAEGERAPLTGPAAAIALTGDADPRTPVVVDALFPAGERDETGLQLDLRAVNSWVLTDAEVTPAEWLQVHVVNAFAPFLLTSRLRPLLAASPHPDRYVVQVTAVEGRFAQATKLPRHPHTNMAKASLNMFTRTVAADYARDGIYMNSVDTGWVTDEKPHRRKQAHRAGGFRPPLDVIDGAARVYDPIVRGVTGNPVHGLFLKDYRSVDW